METPNFQKRAEAVYDSLGSGSMRDTMRIAAALRKVHTDAIESAAKHLESHGCYQTAATIRALATKEDGNGR